jgi:hypothetical protein
MLAQRFSIHSHPFALQDSKINKIQLIIPIYSQWCKQQELENVGS